MWLFASGAERLLPSRLTSCPQRYIQLMTLAAASSLACWGLTLRLSYVVFRQTCTQISRDLFRGSVSELPTGVLPTSSLMSALPRKVTPGSGHHTDRRSALGFCGDSSVPTLTD